MQTPLRGFFHNLRGMVAQTVKNLPAMQETGTQPLVSKIPGRGERLPTPVFLSGESHGRWSWRSTVYEVAKGQM